MGNLLILLYSDNFFVNENRSTVVGLEHTHVSHDLSDARANKITHNDPCERTEMQVYLGAQTVLVALITGEAI